MLINGKELARLMLRYNIGSRDENVLAIKKINEEFLRVVEVLILTTKSGNDIKRRFLIQIARCLGSRECCILSFYYNQFICTQIFFGASFRDKHENGIDCLYRYQLSRFSSYPFSTRPSVKRHKLMLTSYSDPSAIL